MSYNLDPSKISKDDWELHNCREYAIYILTNYSKTEKQLRDKLKMCKKKYSESTIEKTIVFLKEHKLIDDVEFTKRFIELHKNSYSKKVISQKLYQKGIKKDLLDSIYEESEISFDEDILIKKLLLKKCPDYYEKAKDMEPKVRQKIFAFLYRKGFSYENITSVMKIDS